MNEENKLRFAGDECRERNDTHISASALIIKGFNLGSFHEQKYVDC